jgi:hypothetical protein
VKDDKQFYLEYVSGKLGNKVAVKSEIFNAIFRIVFRKIVAEENDVSCAWFDTGVSVPNHVSTSGDAFLRGRLQCPDDMTYKDYLEFMREFLALFTLQRQKTDISVDRVFLHRYLDITSVAITQIVQVAHKETSLLVTFSHPSRFHISIVSSATGACIHFLSGAKISCR